MVKMTEGVRSSSTSVLQIYRKVRRQANQNTLREGGAGADKMPQSKYTAAGRTHTTHRRQIRDKRTPGSPHKLTHLDLAHFEGHARHIVPPLRPSQPVIADEKNYCWGKEPSRSYLPSLLLEAFFFFWFISPFFFCFTFFQLRLRVLSLLLYGFWLSFLCFIFFLLVVFFSFVFS